MIVFIFALVVIFWPQKKVVIEKKVIKIVPASVVLIPTQDKTPLVSDTGAMKTILDDNQYKIMYLVNVLRNESPIKNNYFEIEYDYGIDKFIVNVPVKNLEIFLQWKKDTGYNFISDNFWIIKND